MSTSIEFAAGMLFTQLGLTVLAGLLTRRWLERVGERRRSGPGCRTGAPGGTEPDVLIKRIHLRPMGAPGGTEPELLATAPVKRRDVGGAAERLRSALNRSVLWLTMPALVFQTVQSAALGTDLIQAPAAAIAGMAGTALIAWLLLVRLYGKTPETGALVLAASAGSVSFFGIPIARALFGPDQARVAVYYAVLNVPLALLAAAIISGRIDRAGASAGRRGSTIVHTARTAVRQFVTLPANWALVAGLALQGVPLPPYVLQALYVLAASVAPVTMFALGLSLRFEHSLAPYRMALPAVAIKLAISPLVVFACAWAVGLSGLPLAIVALQGAMPTQVLSIVVAERFRLNSRLVGLTLAMDTALAFVLLPLVLVAIRSGAGA